MPLLLLHILLSHSQMRFQESLQHSSAYLSHFLSCGVCGVCKCGKAKCQPVPDAALPAVAKRAERSVVSAGFLTCPLCLPLWQTLSNQSFPGRSDPHPEDKSETALPASAVGGSKMYFCSIEGEKRAVMQWSRSSC